MRKISKDWDSIKAVERPAKPSPGVDALVNAIAPPTVKM